MEDTNNKAKPQEARNTGKLAGQETKRPWVTPTFERVPLKDALGPQTGNADGSGGHGS